MSKALGKVLVTGLSAPTINHPVHAQRVVKVSHAQHTDGASTFLTEVAISERQANPLNTRAHPAVPPIQNLTEQRNARKITSEKQKATTTQWKAHTNRQPQKHTIQNDDASSTHSSLHSVQALLLGGKRKNQPVNPNVAAIHHTIDNENKNSSRSGNGLTRDFVSSPVSLHGARPSTPVKGPESMNVVQSNASTRSSKIGSDAESDRIAQLEAKLRAEQKERENVQRELDAIRSAQETLLQHLSPELRSQLSGRSLCTTPPPPETETSNDNLSVVSSLAGSSTHGSSNESGKSSMGPVSEGQRRDSDVPLATSMSEPENVRRSADSQRAQHSQPQVDIDRLRMAETEVAQLQQLVADLQNQLQDTTLDDDTLLQMGRSGASFLVHSDPHEFRVKKGPTFRSRMCVDHKGSVIFQ